MINTDSRKDLMCVFWLFSQSVTQMQVSGLIRGKSDTIVPKAASLHLILLHVSTFCPEPPCRDKYNRLQVTSLQKSEFHNDR